jgi:hypothetical protein
MTSSPPFGSKAIDRYVAELVPIEYPDDKDLTDLSEDDLTMTRNIADKTFTFEVVDVDQSPPKVASNSTLRFPGGEPITIATCDGKPCETAAAHKFQDPKRIGGTSSTPEQVQESRKRFFHFYASNAHRWPRLVQKTVLELGQNGGLFHMFTDDAYGHRFWKMVQVLPADVGKYSPDDLVRVEAKDSVKIFRKTFCTTGHYVFAYSMMNPGGSTKFGTFYEAVKELGNTPTFRITAGDQCHGPRTPEHKVGEEVQGEDDLFGTPEAASKATFDGKGVSGGTSGGAGNSTSFEALVIPQVPRTTPTVQGAFRAVVNGTVTSQTSGAVSYSIDLTKLPEQTANYTSGWMTFRHVMNAAIAARAQKNRQVGNARLRELTLFMSAFASTHYGVALDQPFVKHFIEHGIRVNEGQLSQGAFVNCQSTFISICDSQRNYAQTVPMLNQVTEVLRPIRRKVLKASGDRGDVATKAEVKKVADEATTAVEELRSWSVDTFNTEVAHTQTIARVLNSQGLQTSDEDDEDLEMLSHRESIG